MWNYFIPFAAGLLQGKDPLEAGVDAGISGTVGNVAGNFGSALDDAAAVGNFGSVQDAANIPGHLTNGAGIVDQGMSTVIPTANMGYQGPTSMMQSSNLGNTGFNITSAPTDFANPMDKSMMSTLSRQGYPVSSNSVDLGLDANLSDIPESRVDLDVMANQNVGMDRPTIFDTKNSPGGMKYQGADYTPELGQSADYTGGGADTRPLYKQAFDSVKNYVKEKPLESTLMATTVGGAVYEGVKPKQTPVTPAPLGPQLAEASRSNLETWPHEGHLMNTVTSPEPLKHVSAILLHNWMTR